MNNIYMTVLSAPYLPRALALFSSFVRHVKGAPFAFFCMDDQSAAVLESLDLPNSRVFREADFADEALLGLRGRRPYREYCWTAKPFSLCKILDTARDIDWAVFLDADTLAFADLDLGLADAGSADFLFTPHRFSSTFMSFARTAGWYNSGYFACRATANGRAAAARWRELCLESCSAIPTETVYSDQKYLERIMRDVFGGAGSEHIGLNAAPWNIAQYRVARDASGVLLDGVPLLLFHYQSLRLLTKNWFDLYPGDLKLTRDVRDLIYVPYLEALSKAYVTLSRAKAMDSVKGSSVSLGLRGWLSHAKRVLAGSSNLYRFPMFT